LGCLEVNNLFSTCILFHPLKHISNNIEMINGMIYLPM
jgi:hypothetical protein